MLIMAAADLTIWFDIWTFYFVSSLRRKKMQNFEWGTEYCRCSESGREERKKMGVDGARRETESWRGKEGKKWVSGDIKRGGGTFCIVFLIHVCGGSTLFPDSLLPLKAFILSINKRYVSLGKMSPSHLSLSCYFHHTKCCFSTISTRGIIFNPKLFANVPWGFLDCGWYFWFVVMLTTPD